MIFETRINEHMFSLLDEDVSNIARATITRFATVKEYDMQFDYWRIYWDEENWMQANIVCPELQSILKPQRVIHG
jgi:hypothetical protein